MEDIGMRKTTKHTQWLFTILGMWFMISNNSTTAQKLVAVIFIIFCQSVLLFVIIPVGYYVSWYERDVKMKIALAGPSGIAVSCLLKYYTAIYQRKNIKKCLDLIKVNWEKITNKKDREIMMKNTQKGTNITVLCASFMFIGGISHQIFVPFLSGSIISIIRNSSDRSLIYPVYHILFDSQTTPVYEFIYFAHILLGAIVCTVSVGVCNLGAMFIAHLSGLIEIIISDCKHFVDEKNQKNLNAKTNNLINRHNQVIDFASYIEKSLTEICLIEIVSSAILICLDAYYCMLALKNNEMVGLLIYSVLLVSFCVNIFIFCYIGELLKEQYNKAGMALYNVQWYRLPRQNAQALLFMIIMTQNPRRITAGGLMELSYVGFTTVMKTSGAYLNILRMIEF